MSAVKKVSMKKRANMNAVSDVSNGVHGECGKSKTVL